MTRIYIAGPVNGMPGNNAAAFEAAAYRLMRAGNESVINPLDIEPHQHDGPCPPGLPGGQDAAHSAPCYMRTDMQAMLSCDAIYLLAGWEKSFGARAEFNAAVAAGLTITFELGEAIDVGHLARQRDWSRKTFGPGRRTLSITDHIRKELAEIEADPDDVLEWIDVAILALDGAWRAGWEPDEVIAQIKRKQAINEGREWPDWRTGSEERAIEHVREVSR